MLHHLIITLTSEVDRRLPELYCIVFEYAPTGSTCIFLLNACDALPIHACLHLPLLDRGSTLRPLKIVVEARMPAFPRYCPGKAVT